MLLTDLGVQELAVHLKSLQLEAFSEILLENEFSGGMLAEVESVDDVISIDERITASQASEWYNIIMKMKAQGIYDQKPAVSKECCSFCLESFAIVDPTTLPCGHCVCINDAKILTKCPLCQTEIIEGTVFAVDMMVRNLARNSPLPVVTGVSTEATNCSSKAANKKKNKNKKKTGGVSSSSSSSNSTIDAESEVDRENLALASLFESAFYSCDEEAFALLLSHAQAGNLYAIGFVELYYRRNNCVNVSINANEVDNCITILQERAKELVDRCALYLVAELWRDRNRNPSVIASTTATCIAHLERSYSLGFTLAGCELFYYYTTGAFCQIDLTKAEEIKKHCLACGHKNAFLTAAKLEPSEDKALTLLQRAAEKEGVVVAYFDLSNRHLMRFKAANSRVEAAKYMNLAASKGFPEAMVNLGSKALTENREKEGLDWLKKAAFKGHKEAAWTLYRKLCASLVPADMDAETRKIYDLCLMMNLV